MNLYKKNLALLKITQPSLAKRVELEPLQKIVKVVMSKDGNPIPKIGSISLHSTYNPFKEASDSLLNFHFNNIYQPVIYGLGFGYHVLEVLKRTRHKGILVIEPLMAIFQEFLYSVDIKLFVNNTKFIIATPPPKILASNPSENWNVYEHIPSVRISDVYFKRMNLALKTSKIIKSNRIKVLIVNPYYGGSLPTANYCVHALNEMGHHAESVECEKFVDGFFAINNSTKNKGNLESLSKQFSSFMGQLIAAKAADFKPDLILALAQAPLTPEAIKNLKLLNVPVAFWFVEDFRNLTYWKDIGACYDYFFTIQRGEFFKKLSSIGAENHYYLPQACLPSMHKEISLSIEERNKYSADVSFMGAGYFNRAQSFPRLLDYDFKIWGTEWDLGSILGSRIQNNNKRLKSDNIVKIYNAAKINLNLHSSSFHEGVNPVGDFVNPRTFEIAACGGFQLIDDRSELDDLMDPIKEIVTFSSINDLCEKVDYYLNNSDEAKVIAKCGKERVLKEHTIQHRMDEMLIYIFMNNLDQLMARFKTESRDPVESSIDYAGPSTDLGKYLEQFRGSSNFSIKTMVDQIGNSTGDLSKEELLVLMTDQLVKTESNNG